MDSNMSTAAYMHSGRASGSSSASSICGGSQMVVGNGNGGGRMAVIGVTRNIRLRRRGSAGFGFSLRGGREYAAGFYVSDVTPGGEAHRSGLRVGDQIIRVNGYPVEDAVHQEVALLAKNQQVLVLKIRSVGMIPVKDNPNDPVTWHMVQQQQQQLQYADAAAVGAINNEIRIQVNVGEKGRLGCGVCRGYVPGLTVQGTREGGPARAAGLKAGDVITWCNGQCLTDMPFERAIEVMRSSAVLNLIVNRPAAASPSNSHLYDCPDNLWMRTPNYDSDASSIMTENPPLQHQSSFKSSPQHRIETRLQPNRNITNGHPIAQPMNNKPTSADWNNMQQSAEWSRKPNNTTVILINQNQGPNHDGRFGSQHNYDMVDEPLYDPVAPRDFEVHDFDANPCDEINRRSDFRRQHNSCEIVYNNLPDECIMYPSQKDNVQDKDRKTITTVEVHQNTNPPAPPCLPPQLPLKWQTGESKPMNAMGMQMGSTISMGSTGSTETESSLESSCGKDSASTSSSLSTSSCDPASSISIQSNINGPPALPIKMGHSAGPCPVPPPPPPVMNLNSAIAQELQRRAKMKTMKAANSNSEEQLEPRRPPKPEMLKAQEQKVTHDKLMEEFKQAHQRMFSNNQRVQSTEQEPKKSNLELSVPAPPPLPNPKLNDDTVEMQSIDSFKLKESPAPVPKPPQHYFSPGEKTHSPTSSCVMVDSVNKKAPMPLPNDDEPKSQVGKVAIRISAYEGESKQPSRLEFLPQQQRTANDETGNSEPVASRLQNELVATLQRSNLRRKTDEEKKNMARSPEEISPGTVENLATCLNNKVTIRVNPENNR